MITVRIAQNAVSLHATDASIRRDPYITAAVLGYGLNMGVAKTACPVKQFEIGRILQNIGKS